MSISNNITIADHEINICERENITDSFAMECSKTNRDFMKRLNQNMKDSAEILSRAEVVLSQIRGEQFTVNPPLTTSQPQQNNIKAEEQNSSYPPQDLTEKIWEISRKIGLNGYQKRYTHFHFSFLKQALRNTETQSSIHKR